MREDSKRELGTIRSVFSGPEDHDIITCSISIDFNGSCQGFGNLVLGGDLLPDFCDSLCKTFGVKKIQDLVGKQCYALRCFGFWNDNIEGLETMDGKRFTLSSWRKKHFPNSLNPLEQRIKSMKSDIESRTRQVANIRRELQSIRDDYTDWG